MRYYNWRSTVMYTVLAVMPLVGLGRSLTPLWDAMSVKHTWDTAPANWESRGDPPAGSTIDLHVALKPHREKALVNALYEVSNPRHRKYGAHLSKEQVAELVAPHPHALDLVTSWLNYNGVPSSSISATFGGGWLTIADVPVSQANKLLGASYQLYGQAGTNDTTILRTIGYSLPAVLHRHVQTIVPTTCFATTRAPRLWQTLRRRSVGEPGAPGNATSANTVSRESELTVLSKRDVRILPSLLRSLYKTTTYVPAAIDKNKLGVGGYLGQYPSATDLRTFMWDYRDDAVAATYTVEQINGGKYETRLPGSEANLDMQYAQAIAFPTPHIFYSTGGKIERGPAGEGPAQGDMFLEWLNHMLDDKKDKPIPQTISTSYIAAERDLPREYTKALCDMYSRLGALGVSILFASGDSGVGPQNCDDGSGNVQFVPEFPASCPFVTSVGGTTLDPTRKFTEVAARLSGGGFSNHFGRPDYQDTVVPTFFDQLGSKHADHYNATSRGIPDISAQALAYILVYYGEAYPVSGTSCSTPTVAGIISLLNDYLLSENQKPLGFLNPWLYGEGLAGLNDITSGSNPGCGTTGFSAATGWDPVTGLGTPDFAKLLGILKERVALAGGSGPQEGTGNEIRASEQKDLG